MKLLQRLGLIVIAITATLLFSQSAHAATVVSVGDGDTIRVKQDNVPLVIRLACIDAPERKQAPYGMQSTTVLKRLLPIGQTVDLRIVGKDLYSRTVAEIFVGQQSINLEMVREGQAVIYPPYLKRCNNTDVFLQAQDDAKRRQLAFWSQAQPVMPWDFRASQHHKPGVSS